ncbi:hypothetical protein [Paracoccus sp. DMF]|nr:hypothetical protein [Paracoccus sp. DMF]MCV2449011.1 hypothetical protein [Paracoccus sp. DMF]
MNHEKTALAISNATIRRHKDHGWSGSPSRSYKQAMRGWQDCYHAAVG